MAIEIERKFLVVGDGWRSLVTGVPYSQGYISGAKGRTVRIRIAGDQGYLTIKGASEGISRLEFEYAIPLSDAEEMLNCLCDRPLIEKHRYKIPWGSLIWEVDEFQGDNQGLIIAEMELSNQEQTIALPDWIGAEVSHDSRYYNSNLVKYPFTKWAHSS